jgi:hypothetical protein
VTPLSHSCNISDYHYYHHHHNHHLQLAADGTERTWQPQSTADGVELLLIYCYTVVTLLLHCCYTAVTLLLHCCHTVVKLLLHCCCTPVTLLLHSCHTTVALLIHCYLHCSYTTIPQATMLRCTIGVNWPKRSRSAGVFVYRGVCGGLRGGRALDRNMYTAFIATLHDALSSPFVCYAGIRCAVL